MRQLQYWQPMSTPRLLYIKITDPLTLDRACQQAADKEALQGEEHCQR